MRNCGERRTPTNIINLIRAMYNVFKFQVLHKGYLSESFMISSGIRNCCILSPILFITVNDDVMRTDFDGRRGIQRSLVGNASSQFNAFAMLRSIWRSPEISTRTKLRVFISNVKSVLFYG